jgi:hypothetical protein
LDYKVRKVYKEKPEQRVILEQLELPGQQVWVYKALKVFRVKQEQQEI